MSGRILTVVGARPQFTKVAVVPRTIEESGTIEERMAHAGQQFDREMSAVFFHELVIPEPGYNLGVQGGKHGEMTGTKLDGFPRTYRQGVPTRYGSYSVLAKS
ncbi:MAG: hypothetical protein BMS9Abin05_2106 [Rhodothermia bacterium]|nr:MAG: hypothetical protein BMS9Abin05_2106 [Rhodothermia bacterium]